MIAGLEDILRLNRSHIQPAIKVLERAFQNYPLFENYYPDEMTKKKIAYYYSSFAVSIGMRYGEIYATSHNIEGVAVWIPSEKYPMTFWRLLFSVPLPVLFGFGRHGGARMRHLGAYIDAVNKRLASFTHWYLWIIGVDPIFQGNGYASKLLRPMLSRIDKEGLSCYLETLDEHNVPIYEHLGFEVIDKAAIPKTSFTNWAMLKKQGKSQKV